MEWGYTFRDAYLHIGEFINHLKHKLVICACSATIPADSMDIIRDSLHMDKPVILRSDLRRDNLYSCSRRMLPAARKHWRNGWNSVSKLCKLIDKYHKDGSVLIFCADDYICRCAVQHSGRNIPRRCYPLSLTNQAGTLQETTAVRLPARHKERLWITASAFSMGIDVPDIELVVHFNAPISMTDYSTDWPERDATDAKAHCVLFYDQNGDDDAISNSFIKKAKSSHLKPRK